MDYFPSLEVELDESARQLMDAVNQWASAECVDCGAHLTNEGEAIEHERIFLDHRVLHLSSARTVN